MHFNNMNVEVMGIKIAMRMHRETDQIMSPLKEGWKMFDDFFDAFLDCYVLARQKVQQKFILHNQGSDDKVK